MSSYDFCVLSTVNISYYERNILSDCFLCCKYTEIVLFIFITLNLFLLDTPIVCEDYRESLKLCPLDDMFYKDPGKLWAFEG